MKKLPQLLAVLLATITLTSHAATDRVLPLETAGMETITIKGRIQNWDLKKVCIDGQAYLLILGVSGPNGISPSFKDGKPEQCQLKPAK